MGENISALSIPAIAALVYTMIDMGKTISGGSDKFNHCIPLLSAILGAVVGAILYKSNSGIMYADSIFNAIIIGASSGLSATGTNQAAKQIFKNNTQTESEEENNE